MHKRADSWKRLLSPQAESHQPVCSTSEGDFTFPSTATERLLHACTMDPGRGRLEESSLPGDGSGEHSEQGDGTSWHRSLQRVFHALWAIKWENETEEMLHL